MAKALPISFQQATAQYVHRFTMEHVPDWARTAEPNGLFYAPQFRSDAEWFRNTKFPTDRRVRHCCTAGQTWPVGRWLTAPFRA